MLIQVKLLQCASKIFTYQVPQNLRSHILIGSLIQVPLKQKIVPAVVVGFEQPGEQHQFKVRPIHALYPFPHDAQYVSFLQTVGQYYQTDSTIFLKRLQLFLSQKEIESTQAMLDDVETQTQDVALSSDQQSVYCSIEQQFAQHDTTPILLHGVTGSGKTEIYKKLVKDALRKNKSVIIMLPDVTLALRFEQIFAQAYPTHAVIGFHCATPIAQKRLLWQLLLEEKPVVILGVHLPILLPIANLGLIIVDEEHDAGYQEKKHPKLHSRDMAILKASKYKVPIVLGSATPSIQSLYNAYKRGWRILKLHQRFAGNFPQVELVVLSKFKKRKNFWISDQLHEAIADRLRKGEQAIIFLNRRGYSFFVQCPCSHIFSCHQCSVSLTLHSDQSLLCHYCGYRMDIPSTCSQCHASSKDFLKKGIGTQQVVSILQKLFPQARIERADLDSTVKKRSWALTVERMQQGQIDILVGTQSITKGYHFAAVTLVGVLWADLNLHFPMYNAAEVCLQQLIQVAGRAGRQSDESLVIVQTFDEHAIYQFLDEKKYLNFYDYELACRQQAGYPPFKHIAEVEIKGNQEIAVRSDAQFVVQLLQKYGEQAGQDTIQILGPVPSLVYQVKNIFSQKIYIKAFDRHRIMQMFAHVAEYQIQSSIFFTIDPV